MLNVQSSIYNNNTTFCGDNNQKKSVAEQFISDVNKVNSFQEKGDIISRYCWSPTAFIISALGLLGYEFHNAIKSRQLKKAGKIAEVKALNNKFLKTFPKVFIGAIATVAGLQYLFSINSDKKINKFRDEFVKINKETDAKLSDKTVKSSFIGAMCNSVEGEITFNKNLLIDPLYSRKLKKLVKHELVHAKQAETIARSKNGIEKLNYAFVKSIEKNLQSPQAKKEIEEIYSEMQADTTGKYDNIQIRVSGGNVNAKKYVKALYILSKDKNVSIKDLPMVINEKHYKRVIEKKGNLTPQEEIKAQKYYEAMINYPKVNAFTTLNPFSNYYGNLLEREAYKENPTLITFIRHLFVKD